MGTMKTPGVYIVEKSAFPNSVVEVATAVPAFIGYTAIADNKGKSLTNKPWRISSMAEFHDYYGFAPSPVFNIAEKPGEGVVESDFRVDKTEYFLSQSKESEYLLYRSMLLFFQNGGGPCYIVSVGDYEDSIDADALKKGVGFLVKEQEPTMVVIPETVLLDEQNSIGVQQAALAHCGDDMKNRFAILDIWGGGKDRKDPSGDCIEKFRSALGINFLDFAAAYYPWVNTSIVQDKELSLANFAKDSKKKLQDLLISQVGDPESERSKQLLATIGKITGEGEVKDPKAKAGEENSEAPKAKAGEEKSEAPKTAEGDADPVQLDKSLVAMSPLYGRILGAIKNQLNCLPPAAAMAGVYTMVDNSRGVWKAPANVSLSAVVSPTVNVTHDEQEDLNVTTQGKSINAIRSFIGEGTLVWGARTLDGNSLDWRYINVRRTMIMLEESIRLASKAYVFEPNVANTWVTMRSMIRNFLTGIWKRGGLAGAVPDDAFSVHVGLGETMTAEDILEGILRITVLVAISRPAEFIEITFQQQMQKS